VSGRNVEGNLELSLVDTGSGINDEVLGKLFSPLCTTKAQGMGLGLAICKRLVEAHGGVISCETAKGKGTSFTLTLPIEPKNNAGGEDVWINTQESSLQTTMKP
jgi:signal transduction histidine kinase